MSEQKKELQQQMQTLLRYGDDFNSSKMGPPSVHQAGGNSPENTTGNHGVFSPNLSQIAHRYGITGGAEMETTLAIVLVALIFALFKTGARVCQKKFFKEDSKDFDPLGNRSARNSISSSSDKSGSGSTVTTVTNISSSDNDDDNDDNDSDSISTECDCDCDEDEDEDESFVTIRHRDLRNLDAPLFEKKCDDLEDEIRKASKKVD